MEAGADDFPVMSGGPVQPVVVPDPFPPVFFLRPVELGPNFLILSPVFGPCVRLGACVWGW